jgi:hypothetical protein
MKSLNKTLAALALTVVAAGSAFAGDAADDLANRTAFAGTLTRADVQAAYFDAVKSGTLPLTAEGEIYAGQNVVPASTRDRADVHAEAVQTARAHTVHEMM